MIRRFVLIAALFFIGGCNPIEKAYEYNWSVEAPVEERMIAVHTALSDPQVQFAARQILAALREKTYPAVLLADEDQNKYRGNTHITLLIDSTAGLKPQG